MNRRYSIYTIAAAVIVLALGVWLWPHSEPLVTPRETNLVTVATPPSSPPSAGATPVTAALSAQRPTKKETMHNILQTLNHKPIQFYGRVLDQENNPVPDVMVYGSVIYNTGAAGGVEKVQTTSDASGSFSFLGLAGRTFGIGLAKDGYEYGGGLGPFQYTELVSEAERHHPDPNNPVIFRMWKLQGAEPMIHNDGKYFILPGDGTPVRIDLKTGKKVTEGGDLVVKLRVGKRLEGGRNVFDWNAEVEAVDGGVIVTDQKLMNLAPDGDYAPALPIEMLATDPAWDGAVAKMFFLKSRGRIYSRVFMDIHAEETMEGNVRLRWRLNPKPGSRNLEYDPAKRIEPK